MFSLQMLYSFKNIQNLPTIYKENYLTAELDISVFTYNTCLAQIQSIVATRNAISGHLQGKPYIYERL